MQLSHSLGAYHGENVFIHSAWGRISYHSSNTSSQRYSPIVYIISFVYYTINSCGSGKRSTHA